MNLILFVSLLVYQTFIAIVDCLMCRKLITLPITERIRIKFYKWSIIDGWFPVVLIFLWIPASSLDLSVIGLCWLHPKPATWITVTTYVLCGVFLLVYMYQMIMCCIIEAYRHAVKQQLTQSEQHGHHYETLMNKIMIPGTKKEKLWYSFVSLTAGICEEIVWRGCILYLLQDIFPIQNYLIAGILSSILFSLLHSYQGVKGCISSGFLGLIFCFLYYATGSLIPGTLLHFLLDVSSVFVKSENQPTKPV